MAKHTIPKNETPNEKKERLIKEQIANRPTRSEKVSWNRKMNNIVKLMAKLTPIEEQIIDLQRQKMPIFDEIQELREVMVNECIHPQEYLVIKEDGSVECKFCLKKVRML